jgi:hypothetical protein
VSDTVVGFDPDDTNFDHACTFDEWKACGYWVKKGSKSVGRNPLGVALFLPSQVIPPRSYGSGSCGKTMWERSAARARDKGTPFGVVEDFDSFVREAGMLPDLSRRTRFAINDPLEMRFMEIADKHGVMDRFIFGDDEDCY